MRNRRSISRRRWKVFAGCLAALIAFEAPSAERGTVKIVGLGAATCAQFDADVARNPAVQRDYLAWAQGYMSGILLSRPAGVDELLDLNPANFGIHRQLEFLRTECGRRSSQDFSEAVEALYLKLRRKPEI